MHADQHAVAVGSNHGRSYVYVGDDGGVYIVRYDSAADRWELTLSDSGRAADTRLSSS